MRITLGTIDRPGTSPQPVLWDTQRTLNGHLIISGETGAGKTTMLRALINAIRSAHPSAEVHIFDVHGDIDVAGAVKIELSEASQYGINPLKISPDLDFGGPRKRSRQFLAMINRHRHLGHKQEAALFNILNDLYEANGFIASEPLTWSISHDPRANPRFKKRHPTLADLERFAKARLQRMITGSGSKAHTALAELHKQVRALETAHNRQIGGSDDSDLATAKLNCINAYAEFINAIETGREIDEVIKYSSRDVMQSVYEIIRNLGSTGIFGSDTITFPPDTRVHRYVLRSLNADEQRMFVEIMLEELFLAAKQDGEKDEPDRFIVLDEAHKNFSDEPEHITNIVPKEARKFGIGLILANQNLAEFPDHILSNAAVKMILGMDVSHHNATARKLHIDVKALAAIRPQETALLSVKNRREPAVGFQSINLPGRRPAITTAA